MTARVFNVTARRSQGWWALEVTGDDLPYPAFTQARRLDQAEAGPYPLLWTPGLAKRAQSEAGSRRLICRAG
jgi:hypothetical protein